MSGLCDSSNVKELARVVLNSAEENKRNGVAFLLNHLEDVLSSQRTLTFGWCELYQRFFGVVTMVLNLGLNRVLQKCRETKGVSRYPILHWPTYQVRRESLRFNKNLVSGLCGSIEGYKHQMNVHGKPVHDRHLQ